MFARYLGAGVSAVALAISAPATANHHEAAEAVGAASITVPAIEFTQWQLDNGLTVIALPDSGTSTVTTSLWYEVGSKHDPEGRSGFAHLFEHILSRKTENMPYNMINRLTDDYGGTRNASTGSDRTNYYEVVPAEYLETMLWTHAERMARPVVDDEVFERERSVVKEELRQRVLAPPYGRFIRFVLPENAYSNLPQRRPGIGSIEELDSAVLADARAFHQAYYGPDTATLIVAGNFEIGRLKELVQQYFGEIPRRANPISLVIPESETPRTAPRTVHATAPNVPLPIAGNLWTMPGEAHPDRPVLDVIDAILSRGDNSRLHEVLVRTGKAVQVDEFIWGSEEGGLLAQFATLSENADKDEVAGILAAEMARLLAVPVTEAELREAKNELLSEALDNRETAQGRAFELGEALVSTGDPRAADKRLARISAVTAEDVLRVANEWLGPDSKVALTYEQGEDDPASYANPAPHLTYRTVPPADGEPRKVKPEGERMDPPAPGPVPVVERNSFVETRLSNGIELVATQTGNVPIATITVVLPGGSASDPADKAGLSNLAASLADKGTPTRDARAIAAELESLGASFFVSDGTDGAWLSLTAPVANLASAGKVLGDVLRNANFPEEELELERQRTLDGLQVAMKDPGSLADMVLQRAMYGSAAYGSIPTVGSLPRITREDLLEHRKTWWHPGGAKIVVSGGIDPAAARELAESLLGDWTSDRPAPRAAANPAGSPGKARTIVIDMPEAGQSAVVVATRGLARDDADYYKLYLANVVLGGGTNGRLFEEIRSKRALSYGSYSSLYTRADVGLLTGSAQTKHESVNEVAGILLTEFGKLSSEPADETTLQKRRTYVGGQVARSLETSSGFNSRVASLLQQGIEPEEVTKMSERLAAVSVADTAAAAAKYARPEDATVVIVGDASQFLDDLKAIRPNVEVIPADELDLSSDTLLKAEE